MKIKTVAFITITFLERFPPFFVKLGSVVGGVDTVGRETEKEPELQKYEYHYAVNLTNKTVSASNFPKNVPLSKQQQ